MNTVQVVVCMYVCMYVKGVGQKSGPCTATFNDLYNSGSGKRTEKNRLL
jgi:hypothetical protein